MDITKKMTNGIFTMNGEHIQLACYVCYVWVQWVGEGVDDRC